MTLTNNSNRVAATATPSSSQQRVDAANPRAYEDSYEGAAQRGHVNGHIIRWRETDATRFSWDIYLFGAQADAAADVNLSGLSDDNDFSSPDGLYFDPRGLLWVQTDDGAYTDVTNCMMLAAVPGQVGDGGRVTAAGGAETIKGANASTDNLRRFLVGPKDCEITGVAVTPDGRTLLFNVQHPVVSSQGGGRRAALRRHAGLGPAHGGVAGGALCGGAAGICQAAGGGFVPLRGAQGIGCGPDRIGLARLWRGLAGHGGDQGAGARFLCQPRYSHPGQDCGLRAHHHPIAEPGAGAAPGACRAGAVDWPGRHRQCAVAADWFGAARQLQAAARLAQLFGPYGGLGGAGGRAAEAGGVFDGLDGGRGGAVLWRIGLVGHEAAQLAAPLVGVYLGAHWQQLMAFTKAQPARSAIHCGDGARSATGTRQRHHNAMMGWYSLAGRCSWDVLGGFQGNPKRFLTAPDNAAERAVLHRRRGIPVSLAVIWLELAAELQLPAHGICAFPGHFLLKVSVAEGQIVLGSAVGAVVLLSTMLAEMLEPMQKAFHRVDEDDVPLGLYLQAATSREHHCAQCSRNLKEVYPQRTALGQMVEGAKRLLGIAATEWAELRDRGLAYAELGCTTAPEKKPTAVPDQSGNPDDAAQIRAALLELQ
ncbi:hypothetical protein FQA39_LY19023 [Lamprigera yunnana]|nr:hypothetical protein FQA39_LY19023 [Lamprigera yunnana]